MTCPPPSPGLSNLVLPTTVSVVIPVRDGAGNLPDAVRSVLAQKGPNIGALDVILAVGPSSDNTEAVATQLAEDGRVRTVRNPSGTTPRALNAAIEASSGAVVVRCDAQSVLPPGYVDRAVGILAETGAANVGGMQIPAGLEGFAVAVACAMRSPVGAGGAAYRQGGPPGPVDTVYLGVFRREALTIAGGFDPVLERNQDFELNHRLRQHGWDVWFDPELRVEYRPRDSLGALARQYHDYGRWKRFVLQRDSSSLQARQLAPPVLVIALASSLLLAVVGPIGGWELSLLPLLLLLGAWSTALLIGAARATAVRRDVLRVACALGTMHLAWGLGFLRGGAGP
ncbi:MAG: succinoglycan biosynthesis protein ExoA [Glaciecola sp.]|jgi:succinoglycan biosynthesis protein ExoA